jgi:hypothetical protein
MGVAGVRMYHDQALYKEPGGGYTPWHVDQFYWPLSNANSVTVWVPLQATPLELGPLSFAIGSQVIEQGRELAISDESEEKIRYNLRDFPIDEGPYDLGEVSFHAGWTFHRAGPNTSAAPRAVMTVIYIEDGIRLIQPRHKNHENDWNTWMPGVQIGTNVNGKNLDDPAVVEVLAAAESLGACVFVHPWDMLGGERMARHWFPWLVGMPAETSLAVASVCFGGVMERLPRLRIAFAHGGGAAPMTLGRWDHGFRERPDLCQTATTVMPSEAFRRLWFDSLVHDAEALRLLLSVAGPGKVALGTDYPFPLGELAPGAVVRAASWLDDATRASILHGAAAAFLGPRAAHATGAASTAAPPHVNAIR